MSIITRAGDLVYTFRFLKLLVTPWKETTAYKLGLLDENGKRIKSKRPSTPEEKSAYNTFHRLVFNIKRLIEKVPGGSTKIGSYVAALFLLKEKYNISDNNLLKIMKESNIETMDLQEEKTSWFILENGDLSPGIYKIKEDKLVNATCDEGLVFGGDKVRIYNESAPVGNIFGVNVYEAVHTSTGLIIYVTASELVK